MSGMSSIGKEMEFPTIQKIDRIEEFTQLSESADSIMINSNPAYRQME